MLKEFKMEYLETIKTNLRRTSYIYEGDNNVTILKLYDDNCFSIKKEELDLIKVLFEAEDLHYEVIPFKYQKYKKIFEKYEKNGELWFFEWFFYNDPATVELFDFKANKVTDKNWTVKFKGQDGKWYIKYDPRKASLKVDNGYIKLVVGI